jgi:hypothetical protein
MKNFVEFEGGEHPNPYGVGEQAIESNMTPDVINSLWIVTVVTIFTIMYCPLLCWVLPNRTGPA